MVVHGTGVSTAYHAEISSVEADESIRHDGRRYQIVRMADGSEFAFPAAPCEILFTLLLTLLLSSS